MDATLIEQAIALLQKANAELEPESLPAPVVDRLLGDYARAQKLAAYGVAALAGTRRDASELARIAGTSVGRAKTMVATGRAMPGCAELTSALQHGDISLDQAGEIAAAEESLPGAATELLAVARNESFHVLKDKARKVKLEAEQHHDLFARQRDARAARSWTDELGMVHIHLALQPHVGVPISARAEAEAARLAKKANCGGGERDRDRDRKEGSGDDKPFERYLADAYANLFSGAGTGRQARRPELVLLVSHEVAKRGWRDVRPGEVCKIPGVGPVSPQVARGIAKDAFLSGVFYDGKDLRHFARWSRSIPIEVLIALELGEPPDFDGVSCADCGNRFRTEFDHVQPRFKRGPTSKPNLVARCWSCHRAKTKPDLHAERMRPPEP